jgi:hypothetical protein
VVQTLNFKLETHTKQSPKEAKDKHIENKKSISRKRRRQRI